MPARILIFATTFIGREARLKLLDQWIDLRWQLDGKTCDILIVDSCSPWPKLHNRPLIDERFAGWIKLYEFPDNLGHRHFGGGDGWGRAFSYGLSAAISGDYDYVAHIEGDVLFRLPVAQIVEEMKAHNIKALSTFDPSNGYVETGIMFFAVEYLIERNLIEVYDWKSREDEPTEHTMAGILGNDLFLKYWRGLRNDRGDQNAITVENLLDRAPVWITHCEPKIYDSFMQMLTSWR